MARKIIRCSLFETPRLFNQFNRFSFIFGDFVLTLLVFNLD